jgi:hypothetical protein
MTYYTRITSVGRIKTVGVKVYTASDKKTELKAIDWGIIEAGRSANRSCWIESTSNVPSKLTLYTDLWTPSQASNYIILSWSYQNQTLAPGDLIGVTFYLDTSSVINTLPADQRITNFSFDIIIVASG